MISETGLAPGSVLVGRYEIGPLLGEGGAARVYQAFDRNHQRQVAVKVLRKAVVPILGPDRFLREIAIAGQLDHSNILSLLDKGEDDGSLFYVMPLVAGQTLRDMITREGQLTISESVRIGKEVASALAYAHRMGIVHRDIKPSNILLDGERVFIADFGLARAIHRSADEHSLTTSGMAVGTPAYMAPEQSSSSGKVDGRADIYGLGCVLYEMLSGDPPFPASSGASVLLRHQAQPAVTMRTLRPAIPAWLDGAVLRCLEKIPADRFQRAEDLLAVLDAPPTSEKQPTVRLGGLRAVFRGAWVAVLGLVLLTAGRLAWTSRPRSPIPLDTTRIAVLPPEGDDNAQLTGLHHRLGDALARWNGVQIADRQRVAELVGTSRVTNERAARIAGQTGAGRFIRLEVGKGGDSLRLRAGLYDVSGANLVYESTETAPPSSVSDSLLARLAESLLFRRRRDPSDGARLATRSVVALQSYIQGKSTIAAWDLAAADEHFTRAVTADSTFTNAMLWVALTRSWRGLPASQWRFHADRALANATRLSDSDSALAAMLVSQAQGKFESACRSLWRLAEKLQTEFAPWYSAATCLDADRGVVLDRHSPTGWAFRSSYQRALTAWRRAFVIHPGIYRDYRYSETRRRAWHVWNATNQVREGVAVPPANGTFMALPTWEGDSLAFVPHPAQEFTAGRVFGSALTELAIQRQRQSFAQHATEWVAVDPLNYESREALGIAYWIIGNEAAVDSIVVARRMARLPTARARLGLIQALMLLHRRAPDTTDLQRVALLTDSLLGIRDPEWDPNVGATLAALGGKINLASSLWRAPNPRLQWSLPALVVGKGLSLLLFSAAGGPTDSITALETEVTRAVGNAPESDRLDLSLEWLGRPAVVAYPSYRFRNMSNLAGHGDYLLDAIAAQSRGDTAAMRTILERANESRAWMRPADTQFEALLPEALLLAQSGRLRHAAELLDPTLEQLNGVSIWSAMNPITVLLMVRTVALRAELASALGEPAAAARWAGMAARLWRDPDPFLIPLRERMRVLERGTSP